MLPGLEGFHRCPMPKRLLPDVMVVQPLVVPQGVVQVQTEVDSGGCAAGRRCARWSVRPYRWSGAVWAGSSEWYAVASGNGTGFHVPAVAPLTLGYAGNPVAPGQFGIVHARPRFCSARWIWGVVHAFEWIVLAMLFVLRGATVHGIQLLPGTKQGNLLVRY